MPEYYGQSRAASFGLGYVPRRRMGMPNPQAYMTALDRLDAKHYKALEQRNAIVAAIGQLNLNEREDPWKAQYISDIMNKIDSAVLEGSYASALDTATKMAGDVLADPAVQGRVKAQQQYQAAKDAVMNNKNVNQITKDRWLEQNPYHYEDKVDDNGNIIGGVGFTQQWTPVDSFDMTQLFKDAKALAGVDKGGSESATFLDEDGNPTSDVSKGFYGMAVKNGNTWERLSEEKLSQIFNTLLANHPEAIASMKQDRDDRLWQYDKLNEDDKAAYIGSDIVDDKGSIRSLADYVNNRISPALHGMAYSNTFKTVDYGSAYANLAKARKEQEANRQLIGLENLGNTTIGGTIEAGLEDRFDYSYNTTLSALDEIKKAFEGSGIKPSDLASENALKDGRYEEYANNVEQRTRYIQDPEKRAKAEVAVRSLKSEAATLNGFMEGMSDDDKEAVKFNAAIKAGLPMPSANSNKYTRKYSQIKDRIFTTVDGKHAKAIGLKLNDNEVEKVLNNLGISDVKDLPEGWTYTIVDGKKTLKIDKNSPMVHKLYDAVHNTNHGFEQGLYGAIQHLFKPDFVYFDENDKPFGGRMFDLGSVSRLNAIVGDVEDKSEKAFEKPAVKMITNLQVRPGQDYNISTLDQLFYDGLIPRETWSALRTKYTEDNRDKITAGLNHLEQFDVYAAVDPNGNMIKLDEKEKQKIKERLQEADANKTIVAAPSDAPIGHGYGTNIEVKAVTDSKGNKIKDGFTVYVDGFLANAASNAFAQDKKLLYTHEYKQRRPVNGLGKDIEGNPINPDPNSDGISKFIITKETNAALNIISGMKARGESVDDNTIDQTTLGILKVAGYVDDNGNVLVNQNTANRLFTAIKGRLLEAR